VEQKDREQDEEHTYRSNGCVHKLTFLSECWTNCTVRQLTR